MNNSINRAPALQLGDNVSDTRIRALVPFSARLQQDLALLVGSPSFQEVNDKTSFGLRWVATSVITRDNHGVFKLYLCNKNELAVWIPCGELFTSNQSVTSAQSIGELARCSHKLSRPRRDYKVNPYEKKKMKEDEKSTQANQNKSATEKKESSSVQSSEKQSKMKNIPTEAGNRSSDLSRSGDTSPEDVLIDEKGTKINENSSSPPTNPAQKTNVSPQPVTKTISLAPPSPSSSALTDTAIRILGENMFQTNDPLNNMNEPNSIDLDINIQHMMLADK